MTSPQREIKIVIVGDTGSGKTCAVIAWQQGQFPDEYIPTVTDICTTDVQLDGNKDYVLRIAIWDTNCTDDAFSFDRLRPMSYANTDVFMICYSSVNRSSFSNVESKWLAEVKHHCPDVPFVLCALKADLLSTSEYQPGGGRYRDDNPPVSSQEGYQLAKRVGASAYLEFSARTRQGLDEAFKQTLRTVVRGRPAQNTPVAPYVMKPQIRPQRQLPKLEVSDFLDRDLLGLFDTQQDASKASVDVVFQCDGRQIPAHRIILSTSSEYFQKHFSGSDAQGPCSVGADTVDFHGRQLPLVRVDTSILSFDQFSTLIRVLYSCDLALAGDTMLKSLMESYHGTDGKPVTFFNTVGTVLGCLGYLQDWAVKRILTYRLTALMRRNRLQKLGKLLQGATPAFADTSLCVEGQRMQVHKALLVARCPFFRAMLSGLFEAKDEIVLEQLSDSEGKAFAESFVEFIYTGQIPGGKNSPHLLTLMQLADRFGMTRDSSDLIPMCEQLLCEALGENTETVLSQALDIASFAHQFGSRKIFDFVAHAVAANYDQFIAQFTQKETKKLLDRAPELRKAIDEIRIPPWYLTALSEYQLFMKNNYSKKGKSNCCIM